MAPHPLERYIDEYADRAYEFALSLAGHPEEAKELVQEAFVRALDRWPQYDQKQPFEGWFISLLRNLYLDSLKRYEKRHGLSLDASFGGDEDADGLADALPGRDEDALERLERRACSDEVQAALETLSPEHRAILTLSDLQGRSYEDIGRTLGCPLGTVRSRLNRARQAFKKALLSSAKELAL